MTPRFLPAARLARLSLRMQGDERLGELVGLGSEPAFEAIVHRYRPSLVRHCAHVVGQDDADEAVQDALLKAHRALARGTTVHSLGAWLHAIAHNAALGLLRRRRVAAEYREELESASPATEGKDDFERERLDTLVAAVLSLPIRQRQALVMRELEGRSYDEIAIHLGASHGAVRQLLNRARASIRQRLAALIPVELVFRWASLAAGSAPSGALTLSSGGTFAAKISSAILLSAMPVVAVTRASGGASFPAPRPPVVRQRSAPVRTAQARPASSHATRAVRLTMASSVRPALARVRSASAPAPPSTTRTTGQPRRAITRVHSVGAAQRGQPAQESDRSAQDVRPPAHEAAPATQASSNSSTSVSIGPAMSSPAAGTSSGDVRG